jgi:hypothetical protein
MGKVGIQVTRLVDLSDYQEGSIVSRTIIEKKTRTVTFFALGLASSESGRNMRGIRRRIEGGASRDL